MVQEVHVEISGCKPGETWHPLPSLCLLTENEFWSWSVKPGRTPDAIAAAVLLRGKMNRDALIDNSSLS